MKFDRKMLNTAIAAALGMSAISAAAAPIISIKIEDVGSTTNCSTNHNTACTAPVYSSVLDGESGLFRLNTINPGTATNPNYSSWTGDVGTGTIPFLCATSATGSFSTGFLFLGNSFVPYVADSASDPIPNFGGAAGDITGTTLTISSMAFGVNLNGSTDLDTPPDPGTLFVNWVVPMANPNQYKVSFQWSFLNSGTGSVYDGFNFRWLIEGTATTAVPVPASAWLLGSGLAGLVGLARRRRFKTV